MKLLGLMVGVMLTSSMVIAGVHERVDYYCFLKLENGQDWFSEYSFDGQPLTSMELKKQVKTVGAFDRDGKTLMPIASVVECVVAGTDFSNDRAQQLQAEFPR